MCECKKNDKYQVSWQDCHYSYCSDECDQDSDNYLWYDNHDFDDVCDYGGDVYICKYKLSI